MTAVGALVFGLVVGFITYRTLVRTAAKAAVTDLVAVVGVLGGGVVTNLYDPAGSPFAWYAIGLALGMAAFFLAYWRMNGAKALAKVMGSETVTGGAPAASPDTGPQA
jgi:hypothetical protein